jgi:hypothetical protein
MRARLHSLAARIYHSILPTCLHAAVVLISTISLESSTLLNSWSIIMAWMIKPVQAYSLTIFVDELLLCHHAHWELFDGSQP